MAIDSLSGAARHLRTRLQGTLFSGERLYPVTVVDLSEEGFEAEGVGLERLSDEFLLDITLPGTLAVEWSPKAAGAAPKAPPASRLRLAARLRSRPSPDDDGLVSQVRAGFMALSDDALAAVRRWVARQAVAEQPVTRGIGPRLTPP